MTLNIGCILIFAGVYIEKGMGLVIPGFVPDVLGDFYEYSPTGTEILVTFRITSYNVCYTKLLRSLRSLGGGLRSWLAVH